MYRYKTADGKIKEYKQPVKNPTAKGLKPLGWIENTMLKAHDAIRK